VGEDQESRNEARSSLLKPAVSSATLLLAKYLNGGAIAMLDRWDRWDEVCMRTARENGAMAIALVCTVLWALVPTSCTGEELQAAEAAFRAAGTADVSSEDACGKTESSEACKCHYLSVVKQYERRDFRPVREAGVAMVEREAGDPLPEYPQEREREAGDPLMKAVEVEEEEFRPMKESGNIDRDLKQAKDDKKRAVIAVLDGKMKKNTSLSKLLGKDRKLAVKNVVLGKGGDLEKEGEDDRGPGGGGSGGVFGLGGMAPNQKEKTAKPAATRPEEGKKRRYSKVKLGSGSMGQFCKRSDVKRKVKGRGAAIRACYETQLQNNPDLAGKVTVQWIVDLNGRVQNVEIVDNATENEALGACINETIEKIHFQHSKGGMCIVSWPFVFSSGD